MDFLWERWDYSFLFDIVIVIMVYSLVFISQLSGFLFMHGVFTGNSYWLNSPRELLSIQVALWTLGQLVASTGYVVEPYRKYPTLLEVLLNFLKTEQNQGTRREVGSMACLVFKDFAGKMERETQKLVALTCADSVD